MHYKIASIILNSRQKSNNTSEIFISQPDANKEALAGRLFILIEIEFNKTEALKIINFLVNNLNHNYYQSEKIILREKISTLKVEHIFETALAKTNKDLAEFLTREKIKINAHNFNITAGVIYENNLHFSNVGKNKALLIYKSKEGEGAKSRIKNHPNYNEGESEAKYKVADILQSDSQKDSEPAKKISLTKLFSNVISGQLPVNGYFIFTNEALPEYLSNKRIIDIITKLPPTSAAEQIKNTLSKINSYVSFWGLIIKNTTGLKLITPEARGKIKVSVLAEKSISNLSATEEETEKLLTPPGIIDSKKWSKIYALALLKIKNTFGRFSKSSPISILPEHRPERTFLLKDKIFLKKKPSLVSIKKIIRVVKNIVVYMANLLFYLFKLFTSKEQLIKLLLKIKSQWRMFIEKIKKSLDWIKNLDKKNRILFFASTTSLIILLLSLTFTVVKNKRNEQQQVISGLIKTMEQKQNQVEANLLYSNEAGAKKILDELKGFFSDLPRDTKKQIEAYDKLWRTYEAQLEKIRHVVNMEAKELANFINLNSRAETKDITLVNNGIYSADSGQKTIYTLNLSDGLITAIADLSQSIKTLDYPSVDKDNNIYYLNNNKIIELNIESKEMSSLAISLPNSLFNTADIVGFNNRLYLLDTKNNQVYRFTKTPDGFSKRDNWIKEEADFSNATSLSIDGHIYILKNNGQVLKYLKGEAQEFKLESIEPPFTKTTKIIVSSDLEFIYILEPIGKRLAIFDKTGKFLMQYQSNNFTDLKDFTVDEKNKKIYFLNKTSVYEVDGVHFE